ncbi:FkbM family methyltransferase [Hyphobacterium sp.]|uniref:FkbM family methyltransferase n=1 Tax=Hyphobacterium sp. TaxID=2004662 RepID=UPI003BA9D8AE
MRFPSRHQSLSLLIKAGLPVGTVIDVGVHAGTPDLMELFPDKRHILIEPEAAHAAAIAENYRGLDHQLHPTAASNVDGETRIISERKDSPSEITHSHVDPASAGEIVRCQRLDTLLASNPAPKPFLLKIDTDGHEREVLEGAAETLSHCAVAVVEIAPHELTAIVGLLEQAGFQLHDIVDLCYYHDTLSQFDGVFVNRKLFDAGSLSPWQTQAFRWADWKALVSPADRVRQLGRHVARLRHKLFR